MNGRRLSRFVAAAALCWALTAACASDEPSRQEVVADRGSAVMPFDLEKTTHVFEPAPDGGVQRVVADDPADRQQIELIRRHLAAEARAFAAGDFGDPAKIHGHDMPGLEELSRNYERIDVEYTPIEAGGRISYTTSSPRLVDAVHSWFEAQLMDHGSHAESG